MNLSSHAVKLLLDMLAQFRFGHNGDMSLAWRVMQSRGWKSRATLDAARRDLLASGLIMLTRQGGRNLCCLYGVTWLAIDECGGKLEVNATRSPPGLWHDKTASKSAEADGDS